MTEAVLTGDVIDGPVTIDHDPTLPSGATRLPSGGWVALRPTSAVTGRDIKRVRSALDKDGAGTILSGALAAAIGVRVAEWQIDNGAGLNTPLPFNRPDVLDGIPGDDLLALEDLVRPWVLRILGAEKGERNPS